MGDRYDRNQRKVAHPALRGLKPPSEILTWGLSSPARIGHNQGPPLDEPVADAYVRWRWRKAYREAWKTPSLGIVKLRVARAVVTGLAIAKGDGARRRVGGEWAGDGSDIGRTGAVGGAVGLFQCAEDVVEREGLRDR